MKIVTAAEMREIDRLTSERFAVPSLILMENAGAAVAGFVLSRYAATGPIGIVCGKGNNGGDGFVVARKLQEAGREVRLLLLADPAELRGDAAAMFQKLSLKPVIVRSSDDLRSAAAQDCLHSALLIDAILGTGFRPPVTALYAEAIAAMNAASAPIVAVDIPSGADADAFAPATALRARADAIVTFTAPRPAHLFAQLSDGPLLIAPIGSPAAAIHSALNLELVTPADLSVFVAPRRPDAHKGDFGHVLTIGGSVGKAGAAAMAGFAALKAGAGLSTIATAQSVLPTVAGFHPELMTEPLAETERGSISLRALEYARLDHIAKGKDVLAVGPGISRHTDTAQFVRYVVEKYKQPTVLDADGLNAFEGCADKLDGAHRSLVLTPHPGEMSRLSGKSTTDVQADRTTIAREFARQHHCILVLKGHRTLIADPNGVIWVNPTGNPGMATGGTGDVLTGMIAGLIAQHPSDVFRATVAAVYLHGLAGDIARESKGEHSLVATDLIHNLPEAFRRTREAAKLPTVTLGA